MGPVPIFLDIFCLFLKINGILVIELWVLLANWRSYWFLCPCPALPLLSASHVVETATVKQAPWSALNMASRSTPWHSLATTLVLCGANSCGRSSPAPPPPWQITGTGAASKPCAAAAHRHHLRCHSVATCELGIDSSGAVDSLPSSCYGSFIYAYLLTSSCGSGWREHGMWWRATELDLLSWDQETEPIVRAPELSVSLKTNTTLVPSFQKPK